MVIYISYLPSYHHVQEDDVADPTVMRSWAQPPSWSRRGWFVRVT